MAKRKKEPSRAEKRARLVAAAAGVAVPERCDVAVIGGGASGLVAAIAAAEAGAGVVVLERDLECGKKILATGNGRCNFANERLEDSRYNEPRFVRAVCGAGSEWLADVLRFWQGCGLAWTSEEGRLYPASLQAASVRNVLLRRAERAGVVLACGREVEGLGSGAGDAAAFRAAFRAPTKKIAWSGAQPEVPAGSLRASTVVLACGGGEPLVRGFAHKSGLECASYQPVLCPLEARPLSGSVSMNALDGRRARCRAALLRDGEEVFAESGEVLFRAGGLSGIVVFDLSRRARPGDVVRLDLTGGRGAQELRELVDAGGADGLLDPAIARALGGGSRAVEAARALDFEVVGLADTNKAQVTRGGLSTSQFTPLLECKALPGLFACGEALDVDADCGGFNLAWAWESGSITGNVAAYAALGRSI